MTHVTATRASKVMSLPEAATLVPDGARVALGGQSVYQHPMAFVRERRLDEVRRRLLAGGREQTSVSNAALDFGFCHLGRFSADYRRAFGELPSETLRH